MSIQSYLTPFNAQEDSNDTLNLMYFNQLWIVNNIKVHKRFYMMILCIQ